MAASNSPPDHSTQRIASALVDFLFFVVVGLFGIKHVVGGEALVGLLSSYASARFGIAYGKLSQTGRSDGGPPSGSGLHHAVRPPPLPRDEHPWQRMLNVEPAMARMRNVYKNLQVKTLVFR
jgi:hypothetical protein